MAIPTQLSLHGFIATVPELTFTGNGQARFHTRAGTEQWPREPDGDVTKLDPIFCDLVLFGRQPERAYDRFRKGDQFVAAGYVNPYERPGDGQAVPCEEFVARRIGHDSHGTRYTVERKKPDPPQPTHPLDRPAVGI